jgi:hypothetical protein
MTFLPHHDVAAMFTDGKNRACLWRAIEVSPTIALRRR